MAFRASNFGAFGADLKEFADVDGLVPVKGDLSRDFRYAHGMRDRREGWRAFVVRAEEATADAQAALAAWRDGR
jgi:hypothetical protein